MCRQEEKQDFKVDIDRPELTWNKLREGRFEDGDCGSSPTKPKWFDNEKYLRGQCVLRDNILSCMFCHLAGLVLGVAIELPYTVLTRTGHHGTLKELGARYVSTSKRIISWYTTDIFDADSEGAKSIALVRQMHGSAHRTMKRFHPRPEHDRELWMSQFYMATTQISFVGLMLLYPNAVGLRHLTRDEKEAVVHYWRCIGHLLGMSDAYNVCGDSLETLQTLTQAYIDGVLRPAMLNTNAERFKLAKGILESVLISTRNRVGTVNGFIAYWCNLVNVDYAEPLSLRDRLSLLSFRLLYRSSLMGYRLIRKTLNALHLRKYPTSDNAYSGRLPDNPLDGVYDDFKSCPFMARQASS